MFDLAEITQNAQERTEQMIGAFLLAGLIAWVTYVAKKRQARRQSREMIRMHSKDRG